MRKQLGGGMRQAGILAAAGIVALETMVDRFAEDHWRAACLAEGLANTPYLSLDNPIPQTNMVFLSLSEECPLEMQEVTQRLNELGVYVGISGNRRFRLVTHYWITDDAVEKTIRAFKDVLIG